VPQSSGLKAPGGLKPPSSLRVEIPAPPTEQPVQLFTGLDDEEPRAEAPTPTTTEIPQEDVPAPVDTAASQQTLNPSPRGPKASPNVSHLIKQYSNYSIDKGPYSNCNKINSNRCCKASIWNS
jgi:hypothetical protein